MSTFSPREKASFSSMSSNANAMAAQNADLGLSALRTPSIPTDTVFPSQLQQDYQDFFGLADGGKVKGKGGPTDDEVGPVMLSHGEYVLPADTVDIVGRDKLDALRLATHDFVDDSNKPKVSRLRKMADGGIVVNELTDPASRRAFAQARVAINAGNPYGAQIFLNDTIPRASAAPAAAKAAAPAAAEAAAPAVANAGGAGAASTSRLGGALRAISGVAGPALLAGSAAYNAITDSPEARNRAASGQEGAAGVASKLGSYLGSALSFGTSSPQDIGGMISAARGEGTGAYHSAPDAEKGWARRLGDKYFPTESAKIMADGVKLTPAVQARVDLLKRNGIDAGSMTGDDFTRARRLAEAASPGAPSPTSLNDAMGALRSGKEPGGGFTQTNVPGIFGRKSSDPKNDLGEYIGVGKPDPQEDPIMDEIRSALRGLTDGAGNRGGGGGGASIGRGNASDINARYDRLAKQLSGMYSPKGQGNLARRLLELEQSRSNALDADARNQSALRGQDMQASTVANAANLQARMQALQTLGTAANQRSTQSAQALADQLKALQEAAAAERSASEAGVKDLDEYVKSAFPDNPQEADRFRTYVQSAGPELVGKLTTQYGGDRRRAFEDMRQRMRIQDRGGGGNVLTGKQSSGYDPVANVNLDPSWRDILNAWWNGGMGSWDTASSMAKEFLPFFGNALATHDSGQVRPASKLRGDDMRSTKVIEDMAADRPRREVLRKAAAGN